MWNWTTCLWCPILACSGLSCLLTDCFDEVGHASISVRVCFKKPIDITTQARRWSIRGHVNGQKVHKTYRSYSSNITCHWPRKLPVVVLIRSVYHFAGQSLKASPVCGSISVHCFMARRHAPGACPNEGIETPAMGRDDGDTDLLFWETNEETDSEQLQLAVDSEPTSICEFCALPNPGTLMLSICPPRVDCGLRWFWVLAFKFAVCERAAWTVVDRVSIVQCTDAASWWTSSEVAGFIALS